MAEHIDWDSMFSKVKLEDDMVGEIKPILHRCPFCGGRDAGLMNRFPRFHDERTTTYVVCYTCGCRTACSETANEAIEAWNRRAGDGK